MECQGAAYQSGAEALPVSSPGQYRTFLCVAEAKREHMRVRDSWTAVLGRPCTCMSSAHRKPLKKVPECLWQARGRVMRK